MKIELENLFFDKLKTGINLFTGAGFSTLISPSGNKLPDAVTLCQEIIQHFNLKDIINNKDLSFISEFCPTLEYQDFLRKRFSICDYNELYNVLNQITIKTIVTTNIDNLIRKIIDNSEKYYLKNIREYGASMECDNEITYIPLHGDVDDLTSKLYFGVFDLLTVDKQNADLFNHMFSKLLKQPILFLGYNFKDKGVLSVVKNLISSGTTDIWMQFLPSDTDNINLFKSKGCHIIEANIEDLLNYIDKKLRVDNFNFNDSTTSIKELNKYRIPSLSSVASVPQSDYYCYGITEWHSILTNIPYERNLVSELENAAYDTKNIILTGCRFSGKTTILMQLARKINNNNKFYINNITKDEAKFIVKKIGTTKAWIFYNNCTDDIQAYNIFASQKNIILIGTSEEYKYEMVKHLLDSRISYKVFSCSELTYNEALQIYNNIPLGLRKKHFIYKAQSDEKFSMLELIAQNVVGVYTRNYIYNMLIELKKQDYAMFKVVALAAYLSENGSAVSYGNVAKLLDTTPFPGAYNIINKTKDYLRGYNYSLDESDYDQDFYILRSKLFALNVRSVFIDNFTADYAEVVNTFVQMESKYNILNYYIFKRKAYDAGFISSLFSLEKAENLYCNLFQKSEDPYILQQWALCLAEFGKYKESFIKIDAAISMLPNNFSFKNSRAIIMFESNKDINTPESNNCMHRAMEALRQCYKNDKRKIYHAQKFAEFALIFYEYYNCIDYIEEAWKWLEEICESDPNNVSTKTKHLKEKIMSIKAKVQ